MSKKSVKTHCLRLELTIEDPEFHEFYQNTPERERPAAMRDCLLIGMRALKRADQSADLEKSKTELSLHLKNLCSMIDSEVEGAFQGLKDSLDPANREGMLVPVLQLAKELKGELTRSHEELHEAFDPESKGSYFADLENTLQSHYERLEEMMNPASEGSLLHEFTGKLSSLLQSQLAEDDSESPLGRLRAEMTKGFQDLREVIAADRARTQAQKRSTAKGLPFEEDVLQELSGFAESRGDTVESVGAVPGVGSCKVGDFVYGERVSRERIAIEAKDYEVQLSGNKIAELAREATRNREASFSIVVVKSPGCLPRFMGSFHVQEGYIVCTFELLRVAIQWACVELQARFLRRGEASVDLGRVEQMIIHASETAEELQELETSCYSIQKSAGKLSDSMARIRQKLTKQLLEAQEEMRGGVVQALQS
jgi:hypothetical protein